MEFKDWFTIIGILVSVIISTVSLVITMKNRRNALREHLYKEQLAFFIQITEYISELEALLEDICIEKKFPDSEREKLDALLEKIYHFSSKNEILMPSEKIADAITEVVIKAYDLEEVMQKKNGVVKLIEMKPFNESFGGLVDQLREFMGVESLSRENQNLYAEKIKRAELKTAQQKKID